MPLASQSTLDTQPDSQHMGQWSRATWRGTGRGVCGPVMKGIIIIRREVGHRHLLFIKSPHLPMICVLGQLEQNQGYLHNKIHTSSSQFSRVLKCFLWCQRKRWLYTWPSQHCVHTCEVPSQLKCVSSGQKGGEWWPCVFELSKPRRPPGV